MKKKAPGIDPATLKRQRDEEARQIAERKKIQDDIDRREKLRKTRQFGRRSLFHTPGGEQGEIFSSKQTISGN